MINSLNKDSHISQYRRPSNFLGNSQTRMLPVAISSSSVIKQNTGLNTSGISFKGAVNAVLSNDNGFKALIKAAKQHIGNNVKLEEKAKKLILEASRELLSKMVVIPVKENQEGAKVGKQISEEAKLFLEAQGEAIHNVLKKALKITVKENVIKLKVTDEKGVEKTVLKKVGNSHKLEFRRTPEEMSDDIIKELDSAYNNAPATEQKHWFSNNERLNKYLLLAEKNNVAFSATFALLLTCIVRPASIMTLPSDKKNKDDQKYAAAHSIASGVIGYVISTVASNPITEALKKVLNDPHKYKMVRNGNYLEASKKASDCANTWVTRGTDIMLSVPKALLTIALIPPILKYVFGWEKKKKPVDQNVQQQNVNNNTQQKTEAQKAGGLK